MENRSNTYKNAVHITSSILSVGLWVALAYYTSWALVVVALLVIIALHLSQIGKKL